MSNTTIQNITDYLKYWGAKEYLIVIVFLFCIIFLLCYFLPIGKRFIDKIFLKCREVKKKIKCIDSTKKIIIALIAINVTILIFLATTHFSIHISITK